VIVKYLEKILKILVIKFNANTNTNSNTNYKFHLVARTIFSQYNIHTLDFDIGSK